MKTYALSYKGWCITYFDVVFKKVWIASQNMHIMLNPSWLLIVIIAYLPFRSKFWFTLKCNLPTSFTSISLSLSFSHTHTHTHTHTYLQFFSIAPPTLLSIVKNILFLVFQYSPLAYFCMFHNLIRKKGFTKFPK